MRSTIIFTLSGFAAWVLVAAWLPGQLIVDQPLTRADAILILGGSEAYKERVRKAAELFHAGVSGKVLLTNDGVLSGWDGELRRNPLFAEKAIWLLEAYGVPRSSIEIVGTVIQGGTFEEGEAVAVELQGRQIRSLLIVTSPHHTARALWCYQRIFRDRVSHVTLGIVPSDSSLQSESMWWLERRGWTDVGMEFVKILRYQLFY